MSAPIDQWSFTSPFEGVIPHMYLDTAGYVTAGVGFMLPSLAAARGLSWSQPKDVDLDWAALATLKPGHLAGFYKGFTRARLSDEVMRAEFARRLATMRAALLVAEPRLPSWPEPVQIALLDMAYNLGVGGLLKYRKLRAACNARDWATASQECARRGVQASRNEATRAIFEKCALDAH